MEKYRRKYLEIQEISKTNTDFNDHLGNHFDFYDTGKKGDAPSSVTTYPIRVKGQTIQMSKEEAENLYMRLKFLLRK